MTGLTKWIVGLAPCAMVFVSISEGRAQYLTGADRASFIAGAVNGCMRKYGTEGTAKIPRPLFEQYCGCYANGVADRLSMSEIKAENPAVVDPVIQAESKRCQEAMKNQVMKLRRN